jgi:hypothetical protein
MRMYDDYLDHYFRMPSTRPESAIAYFLRTNGLRLAFAPVLQYTFQHVCNAYCGHNTTAGVPQARVTFPPGNRAYRRLIASKFSQR